MCQTATLLQTVCQPALVCTVQANVAPCSGAEEAEEMDAEEEELDDEDDDYAQGEVFDDDEDDFDDSKYNDDEAAF